MRKKSKKRKKLSHTLAGMLAVAALMSVTIPMEFHVYAQEASTMTETEILLEEESAGDAEDELLPKEGLAQEEPPEIMATSEEKPQEWEQENEKQEQPVMIEKTLQQDVKNITITVSGCMPKEAELSVTTTELSQALEEKLLQSSDIMQSQHALYSYDISICYQGKEYEPYLFDESMQVTFTFGDEQELKDIQEVEIFHIDDEEKLEKIEIKDMTKQAVFFEADAFSTYILITKIEYTGEKLWSYGFTGDVQTFTAPVSGEYVFECYGAGTDKSKGSFAKGTIGLKKNETVSLYVGGQNSTFNGGGEGGKVWHSASNSQGSFQGDVVSAHGCGATDVRLGEALENRLIVAGGGGGNGHEGGVNYSYNGFDVSGGRFYHDIWAVNTVSSNEILGQGSGYQTYVNSGDWGSGSYPNHGTYSYRVVTGGGGGGYFGGKSGYAGTSKVIPSVEYQGKEYLVTNSIIENLVYTGAGKCQISLYSLEADVITYYNYNMANLGEAAGLIGSVVSFPQMSSAPSRPSDNRYDYTYLGWDDMATESIEHYTDAETVASSLHGDRNYIAVYESIGKSYGVTLDSADAQKPGTAKITATYHSTLPDIMIPEKKDVIFAGYYTEQNGAGIQIYSASGKGLALSEFDKNTVLYAHWVQPIAEVKQPEGKEAVAGYAGIILTTEARLTESPGYTLSYQWYQNKENNNGGGTPIEAADSRKLVIPQGLSAGSHYFYCRITAQHVLNGQKVSIVTEPSCFFVEKGSLTIENIVVKNKKCIYDGTEKVLSAAINNSNSYTVYYGTEKLHKDNYLMKGTAEPNKYTEAGSYTDYIYVTGADFVDFAGSITMTLEKAEPRVYLSSKNTAYNGKPQTTDDARIYGAGDRRIEAEMTYEYYTDESCTRKTNAACGAKEEGGAPAAAGTYYVHARIKEIANYKAAATKTPAMFNILGTNLKYSVSGFHGIYDGKPHGLRIMNESKEITDIYFSDTQELTENNYKTIGTTTPYEYTKVGAYPVYYLAAANITGGITQYESGVSEIIIEAPTSNQENGNSENHYTSGGNDSGFHNVKKEPAADVEEEFIFPEIIEMQKEIPIHKEAVYGEKRTAMQRQMKNEEAKEELKKSEAAAWKSAQEEKSVEAEKKDSPKEAYCQKTGKATGDIWRFLLSFLLGAAVMLLWCQLGKSRKEDCRIAEISAADEEDC